MPSASQSALKFLKSNLRRGAKPKVRIAVLGQASVGKTALIVRYVTRRFIFDYAPELSTVYHHETLLDQEEVTMDIWDTAGHFQSDAELRPLEVFVRWADAVVIVYSITDRASFNLVLKLLDHVALFRPKNNKQTLSSNSALQASEKTNSRMGGLQLCDHCPDFPVVLVATKCDLWRDRQVRKESGLAIANTFGCTKFAEISTKESIEEVSEMFETALRQGWLYRQHRELSKHRNLTLFSGVMSTPAMVANSMGLDNKGLDKAFSFDNSAFEVEGKSSSEVGQLATATSPRSATVGSMSPLVTTHSPLLETLRSSNGRKTSPIATANLKCTAILSNLRKCITVPSRPLFLVGSSGSTTPTAGSAAATPTQPLSTDTTIKSESVKEESNTDTNTDGNKTNSGARAKLFMRNRANTDSSLCRRRRSIATAININFNAELEQQQQQLKGRRKASALFP